MSRMMQKDWRDRQKECLHIQKKKRNFARRIRPTQSFIYKKVERNFNTTGRCKYFWHVPKS